MNLSRTPSNDFKQNRKITIIKNKRTVYPIHNKPFKFRGKSTWWLQNDGVDFSYNSNTRTWVHDDFYYPHNTNTSHISSVKALVRHLRKQYLPKGISFTLSGRYVGEEYTVKIS